MSYQSIISIAELLENNGIAITLASIEKNKYQSACPSCGGEDRFVSFRQPGKRAYCTRCGWRGDEIKFIQDFEGKDFHAAKAAVTDGTFEPATAIKSTERNKPKQANTAAKPDRSAWNTRASQLVLDAHNYLITQNPLVPEHWMPEGSKVVTVLKWLNRRGVVLDIVKKNLLGWNNKDLYFNDTEFGFAAREKAHRIYCPRGLVVPSLQQKSGITERIKVRCANPDEKKYREIRGSKHGFMVVGNRLSADVFFTESELDALAMVHANPDICVVVIGGNVKGVSAEDIVSAAIIERAQRIFIVHDNDAGGLAMLDKHKNISNAIPCPPPAEFKDIGAACVAGFDLKAWIQNILAPASAQAQQAQPAEAIESSQQDMAINNSVSINPSHNWSDEERELIHWFYSDCTKLPQQSLTLDETGQPFGGFYIGKKLSIKNPKNFYEALKADIGIGPNGWCAMHGILQARLRLLRELV